MTIVLIGAMNLDLIVPEQPPLEQLAMLAGCEAARPGTETWLPDERVSAIRTLAETLGPDRIVPTNGGCAYNTAIALASLGVGLGLELAFVGVAGTSPVDGVHQTYVGPVEELTALGVDCTHVRRSGTPGGVCLSVAHDGDRTLWIHPGANRELASHLLADGAPREDIVDVLHAARVVHVTSFFDDTSGGALRAVLSEVRRRPGGPLISLDPGHVWLRELRDDVAALVELADVVLVNENELGLLGWHWGPQGVVPRLRQDAILVLKHPDGATVLAPSAAPREYRGKRLSPSEVKDATGAGDVFAAGLLALMASSRSAVGVGIGLGAELAREHIRHVGREGHSHFRALVGRYLASSGKSH